MAEEKPKWLEHIQNGSWEPELFISGGAIFTLLQLPVLVHNQSLLIWQESAYSEPIIIAQFFNLAINGLIVGFGLHLMLRGFWIGTVCLSFVYPDGINKKRMDYKEPFKSKLEKLPGPVEMVTIMETVSSVAFSLAFLFFLIILGTLAFFMVMIPHSSLEESIGSTGYFIVQIASYIGIGLGGVYLIDFLTLGFIKKQKFLAKVYYPIYFFYSILTLSFLYRGAYYTFVTNVKPWQVILTIFSYLAISFVATAITNPIVLLVGGEPEDGRFFLQKKEAYSVHRLNHYDDMRNDNDLIETATIQSEIVEEEFLRLFIVHYKAFEPHISKDCSVLNIVYKGDKQALNTESKLECLREFYRIYIDDKQYEQINWRYYTHPITGEDGILAFIHLEEIKKGENMLLIDLNIDESTGHNIYKSLGYNSNKIIKIPFWKE